MPKKVFEPTVKNIYLHKPYAVSGSFIIHQTPEGLIFSIDRIDELLNHKRNQDIHDHLRQMRENYKQHLEWYDKNPGVIPRDFFYN
ncbi:MAG: hypothetical protein ACFB2Y_09695 [Fulvivirga sp.]